MFYGIPMIFWAVLLIGAIFTLAGYFGPEDGGSLELVGLILISIALWKGWPSK